MSLLAWPLVMLVRLYPVSLGLFLGGHSRFSPTCSQYAIEALPVLLVHRLIRKEHVDGKLSSPYQYVAWASGESSVCVCALGHKLRTKYVTS